MPTIFSRQRDPLGLQRQEECMEYVHRIHSLTNDIHQILTLVSAANLAPLPSQILGVTTDILQLFQAHSAASLRTVHSIIGTEASVVGDTLLLVSSPFSPPLDKSPSALQHASESLFSLYRTIAALLEVAHRFTTTCVELSIRFTKDKIANKDFEIKNGTDPIFKNKLSLPLPKDLIYIYPTALYILEFYQLAQSIRAALLQHLAA